MSTVKYPFGPATNDTLTYGATIAKTIDNQKTILTLAMTGDATLNLTIDDEVKPGATLTIIAGSDGTARALTPGSGFTGPVIAGVISKKKCARYEYDGISFKMLALAVQID
jgi:hypothetical protein